MIDVQIRRETERKFIVIGTAILKIVRWGGNSCFTVTNCILGSADVSPQNKISDHKSKGLRPQLTIFNN